ncbi:MAG: FAD-dependent thymidylate synthase [Actinomycetota bacterium]|nr:FAD-dependent thymidylate synthase [Actinomycetota bacterium]
MLYTAETFSPDEEEILRRYFTNLDQPVFALVNLPEVVKGALFARYSRSPKSLRRLFLDEFVGELDIAGDATIDATVGVERAEELYDKVFLEYGDDSIAQLAGVHLACEQASNLLTKVLEGGRLMAYLEQSTRYIAYDMRTEGRYRYYRDPEILSGDLGLRYIGDMDRMFDAYAEVVPVLQQWFTQRYPKDPGDSDFIYRQSIKAKAFDAARGILPAAAQSNVGIYGTGQAYEQLLLRMRAHPLPESRAYADLMLTELRKVIPSFLVRVDRADRGGAWSAYLETNRKAIDQVAAELLGGLENEPDPPMVQLLDFDPDGEDKAVAAMLYASSHLSEETILRQVERMSVDDKLAVVRAYAGERSNRRHKPGRALERTMYRFDVLSDYGAFRDLQRHRMLTIEWQALSPRHGYSLPEAVVEAGMGERFEESMARSASLHDAIDAQHGPAQAGYAVALAYRIRYVMDMNARAAMHLIELRSGPQGHPEYRRVAQEMHRLIRDEAGHAAIAELMSFVDYGTYDLERLDAERKAESRRLSRS